jgi:hypothetical protein
VRWVKVVGAGTGPAVVRAGVADAVRAGWAVARLPGRAATASARAVENAKRIRWACPATGKSAPNAAHR